MNSLITILLCGTSLALCHAEVSFLSENFINSINQKQSTWTAGRNFPEDTTIEYLQSLTLKHIGIHPDPNFKPEVMVHNLSARAVPDTFDGRTAWPSCPSLYDIRDQGGCGSCWAFASTEIMTDRICIHSSGARNFKYSPEDLLTCCAECGDCSFGWMMPALQYWVDSGIVSGGDYGSNEGCKPYSQQTYEQGIRAPCSSSCRAGYSTSYSGDKQFGTSTYVISSAIEQIQNDIMVNGPIIVNFEVFEDFYNYKSGVYQHLSGYSVGFHVVKVIGWGTENGVPYWLIANSWHSSWGDNGFFKMRRGVNECGIENYPYAALPRL